MSSCDSSSAQGKKWLREASMRRLSIFVKNKTEMIGNAAQLGVAVLYPDSLEKSGLSCAEIYHLEQWVQGVETGRQCMLAMLDSRLAQRIEAEHLDKTCTVTTDKDNFKPVDLIRSLLHLPEEFLCDGGYLYETVFQRPPTSVVREALQMLVQTALEKTPSQLGIEQINLAIKQLRLNNIGELLGSGDDDVCDEATAETAGQSKGTSAEGVFRLQIMIELVRIHIGTMNKKLHTAVGNGTSASSQEAGSENDHTGAASALPTKLDMSTIEGHLRTPLKVALEQAGSMSAEELEGSNTLLKPYLKQLSALRVSLAAELKDLQDSRAFLALGLSSEASDEAIKKAYRTLAIRLHPDKPGGDTARFQQLQDAYHEIMRKRKADSAERAAMEEVRNKYRPKPAGKSAAGSTDRSGSAQSRADPQNAKLGGELEVDEDGNVVHPTKAASHAETAEGDVADQQTPQEEAEDGDDAKESDTAEKASPATNSGEEDGPDVESESIEDGEDQCEESEFDVEAVMRGLDGSEDVDEVFRRLAESSKKRSYGATGAETADEGDNGAKTAEPVHYENEAEHAQAVVRQITELLQRIKKSAAECTQLAQLNIKWQKMLGKAMEPPCTIKDVLKVITASSGPKCLTKGSKAEPVSNQDACALQQAIVPVELICDWAQQVFALAMELPNACGVRYAAAASGNKAFIMSVERAMQLSLGALKTVLGLINTQEQLASCVRRVKDSAKLAAANPEIQDLLLEMLRTGIKSNVVTITSAVDRIVETAMAASDVREQVLLLLKEVERQERAEVKLRAMEQESRQAEDDFCEEDREALRKCREDRVREDRAARRAASDEDEKKEQSSKGDSLDDLKDKIRLLQVQLKVQHVQALQNMNSEVVLLQTQILKELQALPFVTSLDSLFVHNCASLLKPRTEGVSKVDSKSTEEDAQPKDFKTSLLTLVAELVDSACHAIRSDVLAASAAVAADISTADKSQSPRELLDQHLGWMRIVLADGSTYCKTQLDAVVEALVEQQRSVGGSPTTEGASAASESSGQTSSAGAATPQPEEVSMRLALLPDYRAKALYLASLVDMATVQDILGPQLLQRLEEILLEGRECVKRQAQAPAPTAGHVPSAGTGCASPGSDSGSPECKDGDCAEDTCVGPVPMALEGDFFCKDAPSSAADVQVNLNDIDDDEYTPPDADLRDVDAAAPTGTSDLPVPPMLCAASSVMPPPPTASTAQASCPAARSCSSESDGDCVKQRSAGASVQEGENVAPNFHQSVHS